MVEVRNAYKRYDSQEVLRGIDLRVEKGSFVVVYGEVGAGKSTLIKMLYFQEFPDKGEVLVLGLNSNEARKSKRKVQEVRRKMGVINQDPRFLNEMTNLENISLVLEALGYNKKLAIKRAEVAIERVGLDKYKDRYPYELSAGQRQKLSVARAISRDPVLLLADDPTLGLDEKASYEIEQLFLSLNEMGTTVIWGSNKIPKSIGSLVDVYQLQGGVIARV